VQGATRHGSGTRFRARLFQHPGETVQATTRRRDRKWLRFGAVDCLGSLPGYLCIATGKRSTAGSPIGLPAGTMVIELVYGFWAPCTLV
jgi:hypothetical protein